MDKTKRLWLLTFLVVAIVVGGGYVGLVSPKASEASRIRTDAESAQQANKRLQEQISTLKEQAKQLPKQQAEIAKITQKMPNNPALPAFIRSLTDAAEGTNIEIIALKPEKPQLLPAAAATTPVAPTAANRSTTGAPAAATPGAVAVPAPQVSFIPVEIIVQGSYPDMQRLLTSFEELSRAMLVSGVKIEKAKQPGPGGGQAAPKIRTVGTLLEMTVTGRLFMATQPAAAPTALTPKTAPTSAASK